MAKGTIKQKTKRCAAKRFKKTGTGKFKFGAVGRRHLLSRHSRKPKRIAKANRVADATHQRSLLRQLPYL